MPEKVDKYPIISCYEMQDILEEQGSDKLFVNVKSKIPALDEAVRGFQDGELYVISGPTKNGKTLLAQSLTVAFAGQQVYSLWFSYEVHPRQFLSCFYDELPLFYMPQGLVAGSMNWIEGKILESFKKYHTRIVFIDHLHYLFDMAQRGQSTSLAIGAVIRRLKLLAVKHRFVIFLLCHTTKPGDEGADLSYQSIRDSSFVSQESDCVIMIQRTEGTEAEARVEFHRRTGIFEKRIKLIKEGKYLQERI